MFEAKVIAGKSEWVIGPLCFPDRGDFITENSIIVIPHGGEKYHVQGMKCKGIITEIGNRLCHLAIVTREFNKTMVKLEGAIDKLKDWENVAIRRFADGSAVVMESKDEDKA